MHNLYAIFGKILEITKQIAGNLVNKKGNVIRRGTVLRFSDLEIISLSLTAESMLQYINKTNNKDLGKIKYEL